MVEDVEAAPRAGPSSIRWFLNCASGCLCVLQDMIRLSVGIEHIDDIKADVDAALTIASAEA